MFADTVELLESQAVKAEIVEGRLPKDREEEVGLVAGSASFDWPGSGSKMRPGAICEHLTSFGGVMHERSGQTPLSEFLRHGAAGSSGTGTEPYAIAAKFSFPYVHYHDLYPFQLRSPWQAIMYLNGLPTCTNTDSSWKFLPVLLLPGRHHLRVDVSGEGPTRLELCFGGPGSYRIGVRQFHAVADKN